MAWTVFEDKKDQISLFMEAAVECHRGIFDRLTDDEKPFFFHYWLKRLNRAECFLLQDVSGPAALVTYPRVKDTHYERWRINSLAVRSGYTTELELPRETTAETCFTTPTGGALEFAVKGAEIKQTQASYARMIDYTPAMDGKVSSNDPPGGFRCAPLCREQVPAVQDLLSIKNRPNADPSDFYPRYYLPILTSFIEKMPRLNTGWCYCVMAEDRQDPVAAVYYSGWELPLTGIPCALVDDILVLPEYRGRGLASSLQAFAYKDLKTRGLRWVCGNIQISNLSSKKQAEKCGRTPWTTDVNVFLSGSPGK